MDFGSNLCMCQLLLLLEKLVLDHICCLYLVIFHVLSVVGLLSLGKFVKGEGVRIIIDACHTNCFISLENRLDFEFLHSTEEMHRMTFIKSCKFYYSEFAFAQMSDTIKKIKRNTNEIG